MADRAWLQERETGRYFLWGTGPNGEPVRRYSEELDATNQYPQPRNEPAYQPNYQPDYRDQPQSYSDVYEKNIPFDTRSSGLLGGQSLEVPRSYHSSRGGQSQSTQYPTGGRIQNEPAPSSSSRREPKYSSSGGYDPTYGPASSSGPAYQISQASSNRDAAYDEPDSLARATARLNINEFGSGTNYGYSPPQSKPQYTAAAPPGRGRGLQTYPAQGRAGPRGSSRVVRPTEGETEQLDRSYRMRNTDWKKFFECGRVFKTLWTDPAGPDNASENSQFMSKARYKVAHGQYVYSKIRRFIVVYRRDHSCQCLPVTTYDGKGYRKRNIKLEEHGLVYTGDPLPKPVPGIVMEPLRIKDATEDLDISYINYGRSYCVDTNVKVKDVGVLDSISRKLLKRYYQAIHFLDEDDGSPVRPPDRPSGGTGGTRPTRESELLGMGGGLQIPQQLPPSSDYLPSGSQYGDEQYGEDILAATSRQYPEPVDPRYQYSTSSGPVEGSIYSTSSSRPRLEKYRKESETVFDEGPSRPRLEKYRRDSEPVLDEGPPIAQRSRRESNAQGGGRHRRKP